MKVTKFYNPSEKSYVITSISLIFCIFISLTNLMNCYIYEQCSEEIISSQQPTWALYLFWKEFAPMTPLAAVYWDSKKVIIPWYERLMFTCFKQRRPLSFVLFVGYTIWTIIHLYLWNLERHTRGTINSVFVWSILLITWFTGQVADALLQMDNFLPNRWLQKCVDPDIYIPRNVKNLR